MSHKDVTFSPAAHDMPIPEFRESANAVVEWVANYLTDPRQYPVLSRCQPGDLERRLPTAAPLHGEAMDAILTDFERCILPAVTHWNHPNFHAYFSISSSGPGILGEFLTATLDANAMLWKSCPAATELEQITTSWVLDWLGLPPCFGMIVDSASNAVLQAVVAARQLAEPSSRVTGPSGRLIAYVSEQTHCSVEKAAIAAGIGQANIRHIAVDEQCRMRADILEKTIRADLAAGLKPFFAVATVGTTSSTAVDPVPEIAAICRNFDLWLHIDGAYGGTLAILPEYRYVLEGVELADSFVVNPHKLMLVPLDCSLFYTRHPHILRNAFCLEPEYLKTDVSETLDYSNYGLALGRRFRALKLWFVMRYFGRNGLAAVLRKNLDLAAWLGEQIAADPRFVLAAPTKMGLVCFRAREGDDSTRQLMQHINSSGRFFVSHTVISGRVTIRAAIGNIRTERHDVQALWAEIAKG